MLTASHIFSRSLAVAGALFCASMATATPPAPANPEFRWDPVAPENVADRAAFLVAWVGGIDGGDAITALECFHFRNHPPSVLSYIFHREEAVFSSLYAHRLSYQYKLFDLMVDDPKVRYQFRDYVVAGKIETPLDDGDPEAIVKHLNAIADAMYTGEKYESVAGYEVVDGKLISTWLKPVEEPPQVLPPPPPELPDDCSAKWVRRSLINANLMSCLRGRGLYFADDGALMPDFDCDDFAWMALNWLYRTLKQIDPEAMAYHFAVCWTCPDGSESCHSVVKIESGGMIYFYDPHTGEMRGPYANDFLLSQDKIFAILKQLLTADYLCSGAGNFRFPSRNPWAPWRRPNNPLEAPPFDIPLRDPRYTVPWCHNLRAPDDAWERFKALLSICCAEVNPVVPITPPSLPPGCPALPTPPGPPATWWPDPCDPLNYTKPSQVP